MTLPSKSRIVLLGDSIRMMENTKPIYTVVTSLPDAAETGQSIPDWSNWFAMAACYCMKVTHPESPTIFFQTDRRHDGEWASKAGILMSMATSQQRKLMWHKIVLRRDPGKVDIHRPTYSHLMAFTEAAKPGKAWPDVIPPSPPVYPNGMPMTAAFLTVGYAARFGRRILDPFCGRGTVLAFADRFGVESTGVDIDPDQCIHARKLVIDDDAVRRCASWSGFTGYDPIEEPDRALEELPL